MKLKHVRPTDLPLPSYQTAGAAGLDLYSDEDVVMCPGDVTAIATNVAVEIPEGFEGQVRGRSGMAFKHGVLGYVGTIDSDYRGEVKALLLHAGRCAFEILRGDRIAQLVISPVARVTLESGEFTQTERGEKGFGSTGAGHRIWDAAKGVPGEPTPEQVREWADNSLAFRRVFGKDKPAHLVCDHANELPLNCPCATDCVCRQVTCP